MSPLFGKSKQFGRSKTTPPKPIQQSLVVPGTCLQQPQATPTNLSRGVLWIDGAGGFDVVALPHTSDLMLSCGRPVSESSPFRLEISGPLSQNHFLISFTNKEYVLTPQSKTQINGQQVDSPTPLQSGDVITLDALVSIQFEIPSALSRTARLKMITAHRWAHGVDQVVLLDRVCLIGPDDDCPIHARHLNGRVLLFDKRSSLYLKEPQQELHNAIRLLPAQHTVAGEISLRLENWITTGSQSLDDSETVTDEAPAQGTNA